MSQDENNKKTNTWFIYGLIIFLIIILVISFIPNFELTIENNHLIIISIIVGLLLFRYFDIIEIPGFLKLSKQINELQNETKEIKKTQMDLMQTFSMSQTMSSNNTINIMKSATEDTGQEAEELLTDLPELPKKSKIRGESKTFVQSTINKIIEHATDRDYSSAFVHIRRTITSLLKDISGIKDPKIKFYPLLREAQKKELISSTLADSIRSVRKYSNLLIHMDPREEKNLSSDQLDDIVELSVRVINELEKISVK